MLAEAEQKASEILEGCRTIESESDALATATQVRVDAILRQARRVAGRLLDQAQWRSAELGQQAQECTDALAKRGADRIEMLRQELATTENFLREINEAATAETVLEKLDVDLTPMLFVEEQTNHADATD